MVWGTITYHVSGILAFVDGNMNSQKYINVSHEDLWPVIVKYFGNSPWHFMDDNCPVHRSQETEKQYSAIFWPPQSPDLNPIENVWLVLKNHVKRWIFNIYTTDDLKRELQYAWENL
jgi:transposase